MQCTRLFVNKYKTKKMDHLRVNSFASAQSQLTKQQLCIKVKIKTLCFSICLYFHPISKAYIYHFLPFLLLPLLFSDAASRSTAVVPLEPLLLPN